MKKYEYKCVCIICAWLRKSEVLNEYGKDGWELVTPCWIWHYFKREI